MDTAEEQTARISGWLESELGGKVTAITRQARWRPVWFADVDREGEQLELCIRGERTDMPMIFPLDHEMRFQALLHERGIPTPRVYGWIEEPRAYVMDRAPGRNDFAEATDDERSAVVDEYVQVLARLHSLDVSAFVDAGIVRSSPAESGVVGLRRYEDVYRSTKHDPEPFMEFCLAWLRRNPADGRGRQAPIVWDSGQFHHEGGRLTAVLDLELGHLGDPMMDLAAWRMRDTVIGYGDFNQLYERYATLTGQPVDVPAIQIHHVAFTLTNQLAFGAALKDPPPESDLMTNLQWCCETNLFATEALAEILDIALPDVDVPEPRRARSAPAHAHLVRSLRVAVDDEWLGYELRRAFRMARYLQRSEEIGDAVADADLDDLGDILGWRPDTWQEGDAALERFVLADAEEGRHDAALVALFHRRNLRAQMLLGPPGSAMTRHLPIQTFAAVR